MSTQCANCLKGEDEDDSFVCEECQAQSIESATEALTAARDAYGAQCVRYRQGLGQLESMLNLVRRADGRPNKEDVEDLLVVLRATLADADEMGRTAHRASEVKP